MPGEKEIIAILNALLPQGRLNRVHESDCEIIDLDGKPYLFTTDEFSAEDRFLESNPRNLGWNVAAGALSDIYACGGRPLYYAHALTVSKAWATPFIEDFGKGIAAVLKISGARFIGGDCGQANEWRCCVTVLGAGDHPLLTRLGAKNGDGIYLTGRLGVGNVQAALGLVSLGKVPVPGLTGTRFPLRHRESALIKDFASTCIDTSDGVWNALSTIADLNGCGYEIDLLPYCRTGLLLAKATSLPPLLLFLGECGEYELLCTVPAGQEQAFCAAAQDQGFHFFRLGSITNNSRTVAAGKRTFDLSGLRIEARNFASSREYLAALTAWINTQEAGPAA
jgi:thiamine-monophosphate kinase